MKKYFFYFIILFLLSCSSNSKEEKMKNVVNQYFHLVKTKNIIEIPKLIRHGDMYAGVIQSEAYFLHNHYNELKIDELLKNIKIKDTLALYTNQKQQYIQFRIKKSEDNLPLIITFTFDEMFGLDKLQSPIILENHIYWNKSLDSLNKKGIFPTNKF